MWQSLINGAWFGWLQKMRQGSCPNVLHRKRSQSRWMCVLYPPLYQNTHQAAVGWVQQHVAGWDAPLALIFRLGSWCSSGGCVTAKLVSEKSQAFRASAFAGLLGSCFGTCIPTEIQPCFAEHSASKTLVLPVGSAQTHEWTMKRPARSGAETCFRWSLSLPKRFHLSGCCASSALSRTQDEAGEVVLKELVCSLHSALWLRLCVGTDIPPLEWGAAAGWCCRSVLNGVFLDKRWKIPLCPLLVMDWATERKCHGGICLCCWPLRDTRELLITRPLFCLIQSTKQCFIGMAGRFPSVWTQRQSRSKLSWGILGFPVTIHFNPHSILQRLSACSVAMKRWRSFQREMCFWIWDLVLHFWPGKLPLEQ